MKRVPDSTTLAIGIVLVGVLMVGYSAVVPHYTTGYRLAVDVLIAGIVPYFIYGLAIAVAKGWSLLLPGIALVASDIAMRVAGTVWSDSAYTSGAIFAVPLLAAFVILPVACLVGTQLDRRASAQAQPQREPHHQLINGERSRG